MGSSQRAISECVRIELTYYWNCHHYGCCCSYFVFKLLYQYRFRLLLIQLGTTGCKTCDEPGCTSVIGRRLQRLAQMHLALTGVAFEDLHGRSSCLSVCSSHTRSKLFIDIRVTILKTPPNRQAIIRAIHAYGSFSTVTRAMVPMTPPRRHTVLSQVIHACSSNTAITCTAIPMTPPYRQAGVPASSFQKRYLLRVQEHLFVGPHKPVSAPIGSQPATTTMALLSDVPVINSSSRMWTLVLS